MITFYRRQPVMIDRLAAGTWRDVLGRDRPPAICTTPHTTMMATYLTGWGCLIADPEDPNSKTSPDPTTHIVRRSFQFVPAVDSELRFNYHDAQSTFGKPSR
jgi:hypothetical protein